MTSLVAWHCRWRSGKSIEFLRSWYEASQRLIRLFYKIRKKNNPRSHIVWLQDQPLTKIPTHWGKYKLIIITILAFYGFGILRSIASYLATAEHGPRAQATMGKLTVVWTVMVDFYRPKTYRLEQTCRERKAEWPGRGVCLWYSVASVVIRHEYCIILQIVMLLLIILISNIFIRVNRIIL